MQSGNTWDLHYIAPQFLAWFYPANSEVLHAVGMNAFDRDLLSPLLNLGWFVGCLGRLLVHRAPVPGGAVVAWRSGRLRSACRRSPTRRGRRGTTSSGSSSCSPPSRSRSTPGRAEPRRRGGRGASMRIRGLPTGALVVAGLAAGLAAGTKLNFLLPAAVLVVGLAVVAPRGAAPLGAGGDRSGGSCRRRLLVPAQPRPHRQPAALVRQPRTDLPAGSRPGAGRPRRAQRARLPDRRLGLVGLVPARPPRRSLDRLAAPRARRGGGPDPRPARFPLFLGRDSGRKEQWSGGRDRVLAVAGLAGLAAVLAWLVAPTSASGPEGMPHGFESGLRYLAPALVLGLALLPATPPLRDRLARSALGGEAWRSRITSTQTLERSCSRIAGAGVRAMGGMRGAGDSAW